MSSKRWKPPVGGPDIGRSGGADIGRMGGADIGRPGMGGPDIGRPDMGGGIMAWKAAGLPVVNTDPATGLVRDRH